MSVCSTPALVKAYVPLCAAAALFEGKKRKESEEKEICDFSARRRNASGFDAEITPEGTNERTRKSEGEGE